MLYAYGATLVEIVRRKEFGEQCDVSPIEADSIAHSTVLLHACAKHTGGDGEAHVSATITLLAPCQPNFTLNRRTNEQKRRQIYRGEVQGQLPFDTKGMDSPVPSVDFSPTRSGDAPYELERADING